MSVSTNVSTGLYIYAFLNTDGSTPKVPENIVGIDGAAIQFQLSDKLAMAMSPIESKKIRPQRKNLAAHQEVVTYLARNYDMLPVAFGLIADDISQVDRLLTTHHSVLSEQIDRVAGHMEMYVHLRWTVPNVIQYFVERYSELAEARNAIASGNATRDDQIAVGQMLEKLISAERQEYTDRFINALNGKPTGQAYSVDSQRDLCKEIDVQPVRDEADVMRLACLIPRDAEDAFSQAVYQAASEFSDEFAVAFNGPWPTYSFVNLSLSLE